MYWSFFMAEILLDSYPTSNQSSTVFFLYDSNPQCGQSFTGDGGILSSAKFYGFKHNNPTGNVYAKIYAHSGTFGTSSLPTGSPLATSDPVSVDQFGANYLSPALVTFTFSGANKITLANGTKYVLVIEYGNTGPVDQIRIHFDNTSPTHEGNAFENGTAYSTRDLIFYIYKSVETYNKTVSSKARINKLGDIKTVSAKAKIIPDYTEYTKTVQSKSRIKKIENNKTVSSKSRIKSTGEIVSVSAKANIFIPVEKTQLVSPTDNTQDLVSPIVLVWELPDNEKDSTIHCHIQVDDTDNTFSSLEHEQKSWEDQSNIEYFDGADWQLYPSGGVNKIYAGNQARLTVSLTDGEKFWRVRGRVG